MTDKVDLIYFFYKKINVDFDQVTYASIKSTM